jgi:GNAT superfamily N-acetyltransferase
MNSVVIRTYEAKDVDYVIRRHRELYEEEYKFSKEFSDYVEKYVLKFHEYHDETKENMWIAEVDGKASGVVALVNVDDDTAQLRWFLIEPEFRGRGLGRKLLETLLEFCREKGYKHILLWTVNILEAARHLYGSYGFKLTESVENKSWTDDVIFEERWDLFL